MEEDGVLVCECYAGVYVWCANRARPKEFVKKPVYEDSDEEESTVGKMPPSESDEE